MSMRTDLRQYGGQISPRSQSVQKANALAQDKGLEHIQSILETEAAHLLEGGKSKRREKVYWS